MVDTSGANPEAGRVLVKLRASPPLVQQSRDANLRPVFDRPRGRRPRGRFGPAVVHRRCARPPRLAGQRRPTLGLCTRPGSGSTRGRRGRHDVRRTGWVHGRRSTWILKGSGTCASSLRMGATARRSARGELAWHLGEKFSQLAAAREAVRFTEPRVRIATWTRATTWTMTRCRSISSASSAEALLRPTVS